MEELINVKLINNMGDDELVVNSALILFGKSMNDLQVDLEHLINHIIENNKLSPFENTSIIFKIDLPLFLLSKFKKHYSKFQWNEMDNTFTLEHPRFYTPTNWRTLGDKDIIYDIRSHNFRCITIYNDMISKGISPEMAIMVIPQNIITNVLCTGTLYDYYSAWSKKSIHELDYVMNLIGKECEQLFPLSWKCLIKN